MDVDDLENSRKRICRISEIEPQSRQVASALKSYGISYGDVIQIVLPSSAYYFFPVFGAWMLGAAVSLSDPGKLKYLKLQEGCSVPRRFRGGRVRMPKPEGQINKNHKAELSGH